MPSLPSRSRKREGGRGFHLPEGQHPILALTPLAGQGLVPRSARHEAARSAFRPHQAQPSVPPSFSTAAPPLLAPPARPRPAPAQSSPGPGPASRAVTHKVCAARRAQSSSGTARWAWLSGSPRPWLPRPPVPLRWFARRRRTTTTAAGCGARRAAPCTAWRVRPRGAERAECRWPRCAGWPGGRPPPPWVSREDRRSFRGRALLGVTSAARTIWPRGVVLGASPRGGRRSPQTPPGQRPRDPWARPCATETCAEEEAGAARAAPRLPGRVGPGVGRAVRVRGTGWLPGGSAEALSRRGTR